MVVYPYENCEPALWKTKAKHIVRHKLKKKEGLCKQGKATKYQLFLWVGSTKRGYFYFLQCIKAPRIGQKTTFSSDFHKIDGGAGGFRRLQFTSVKCRMFFTPSLRKEFCCPHLKDVEPFLLLSRGQVDLVKLLLEPQELPLHPGGPGAGQGHGHY